MNMQRLILVLRRIVSNQDALQRRHRSVEPVNHRKEPLVDDQQPAFAMLQRIFDLRPLVASVHGYNNGAETKAGEVEDQHFRPVGKHQAQPLPPPKAQPRQHTSGPVYSFIELSVTDCLIFKENRSSVRTGFGLVPDQIIENPCIQ